VTAPGSRGAIVIDTADVFSADRVPTSRLAERYAPIITGRPAFISFQTAAELRYGAIRRGWGEARMLKLDSKIRRAEVVHTGPELVAICAQLRADCAAIGHALAQREHNADRWIAATAIRLGIPLVSNDTIFKAVPGPTRIAHVKRPSPSGSAASVLARRLADPRR
jgi:tRNA(fMet)-specific endonuclease VapC